MAPREAYKISSELTSGPGGPPMELMEKGPLRIFEQD